MNTETKNIEREERRKKILEDLKNYLEKEDIINLFALINSFSDYLDGLCNDDDDMLRYLNLFKDMDEEYKEYTDGLFVKNIKDNDDVVFLGKIYKLIDNKITLLIKK